MVFFMSYATLGALVWLALYVAKQTIAPLWEVNVWHVLGAAWVALNLYGIFGG